MNDWRENVTEEQKNATAIAVMRSMLETLSEEKKMTFEQELLSFAQSNTYQMLFDFDTGLWHEGPDYLRDFYDEERISNHEIAFSEE